MTYRVASQLYIYMYILKDNEIDGEICKEIDKKINR